MSTDKIYRDFIQLVADSRQMEYDSVNELARGRVWNGLQAKDRGLIDQTGTLQEAIDSAARIAGLGTDFEVVYDERELTTFEAIMLELTASAGTKFGWLGSTERQFRNTMLETLLQDLRILARSSGEFSVLAHCLCRLD